MDGIRETTLTRLTEVGGRLEIAMIHIMLPAQYASPVHPAEPQRRLMAAVLRAVIDDCRGGSDYRRSAGKGVVGAATVRQAVAYVASTDRAWPFSFENLCDALGLDATALRDELIVVGGVGDPAQALADRLPEHEPSTRQLAGGPYCPQCGEVVNGALPRRTCSSERHVISRRQGSVLCV